MFASPLTHNLVLVLRQPQVLLRAGESRSDSVFSMMAIPDGGEVPCVRKNSHSIVRCEPGQRTG